MFEQLPLPTGDDQARSNIIRNSKHSTDASCSNFVIPRFQNVSSLEDCGQVHKWTIAYMIPDQEPRGKQPNLVVGVMLVNVDRIMPVHGTHAHGEGLDEESCLRVRNSSKS